MDGPVWIPTEPPSMETFLAPTLQPIPLIPAIAVVMGLLYLAGAVRLWSTGRRWPVWRTLCFVLGCAAIAVTMGAGVEGYGLKMFSVFIFQQLTLMMAIPPFLVLARPGTLLLRATPHRGLGRVVLRLAHAGLRSRLARIALHPGFTVSLFLLTYYGIYLSGMDDRLLSTWSGHMGLELLFLTSGILFTIPILSSDPLPAKQGFGGRLLDVAIEMPLHAFFGVVLMVASTPIVEFFATPPASWDIDPMHDQKIAGGLAWAYAEAPTVLILVFLLNQWFRSDTRQARRADAEADLNGTPELDAYNAYLEQLADTDPGPAR